MWKGHTAPIDGAAYLTDQLYATVSQDGSLSLWDLGLKKPRSTVPNAHAGRWVTAVAACRQSDLFATGSRCAPRTTRHTRNRTTHAQPHTHETSAYLFLSTQ